MDIIYPRIEIPEQIEYPNLNPLDGSVAVYALYRRPQTYPKYRREFSAFVDEKLAYIKLIRPETEHG